MRLLSSLCLAFCFLACGPLEAPDDSHRTPKGPEDPLHLLTFFNQVVTHAKAKDAAAVLKDLEPLFATEEDLKQLFGPEVGPRAWVGYRDVVLGELRKEAATVIIEKVAEGFDQVQLEQVGPAYPERTTPGDQLLLDRMVKKRPLYMVRLHKKDQELGLRFNGFVFVEGKWRALLKVYNHLDAPVDVLVPDAAPVVDGGVPADGAPSVAPDGPVKP